MLLSLPATIKILCVFGMILSLNWLRFQLSLSLFIGSILLGLWMNLDLVQLLSTALHSIFSLQSMTLILIVGMILVISRLMEVSGHLNRIVKKFSILSKDERITGSMMPALIGLLPMPGGALFSAPMVDAALRKHPITAEEKTAVNYWFRHIWEYWWPLYPGVVLAVALLNVDTWRFMVIMCPLTIVTVMAGVIFILRPLGKTIDHSDGSFCWSDFRMFLWEAMPIFIVIIVIMVLSGIMGGLNAAGIQVKIPGGVSILPGLAASTIWVCAVNRIPGKQVRSAIFRKQIVPMLLLVAAIMFFKGVMTDSRAVLEIRNELMAYGIPLLLIILVMPFFSGLITGIAIGFVGISFPLIIPMFPTQSMFEYLLYAAVAYAFGYMGMMLSPVHLCFLVTKDYFKAGMLDSYRHLILPAATVMITSLLAFLLLRAFLNI